MSSRNRLAAGPAKKRNIELLALMEAGVVEIFEPDPELVLDSERGCYNASTTGFGYLHEGPFDVFVQARIAPFCLDLLPSSFFSLRKKDGIF